MLTWEKSSCIDIANKFVRSKLKMQLLELFLKQFLKNHINNKPKNFQLPIKFIDPHIWSMIKWWKRSNLWSIFYFDPTLDDGSTIGNTKYTLILKWYKKRPKNLAIMGRMRFCIQPLGIIEKEWMMSLFLMHLRCFLFCFWKAMMTNKELKFISMTLMIFNSCMHIWHR